MDTSSLALRRPTVPLWWVWLWLSCWLPRGNSSSSSSSSSAFLVGRKRDGTVPSSNSWATTVMRRPAAVRKTKRPRRDNNIMRYWRNSFLDHNGDDDDDHDHDHPIVGCDDSVREQERRTLIRHLLVGSAALSTGIRIPTNAAGTAQDSTTTAGFVYSDTWTGTQLAWQSLEEVILAEVTNPTTTTTGATTPSTTWTMARWPDPVLRRAAQPVPRQWLGTPELRAVLQRLRQTALSNGAVGLAAQQCGIDARIIYLQQPSSLSSFTEARWRQRPRHQQSQQRPAQPPQSSSSTNDTGWMLINPRIVQRSPERDMRAWCEECLVLPPSFRATVLRDDWVDVEYDNDYDNSSSSNTTDPPRRSTAVVVRFHGELARALQHEYDHDRGILITDHVTLDDLESDVMRRIEGPGHDDRMERAYSRAVE